MKKIVYLGLLKGVGGVFAEVTLENGRLSIHGVEGPMRNGDCRGSCGQIRARRAEYETDDFTPAEGWDRSSVRQLFDVWDRWHLNDMRAGSPAQSKWLRDHTDDFPGYPKSHYDWACEELAKAGLHPDPNYIHNGAPYKYGSAWLSETVPEWVIAYLESLPSSPITPAWV